MRWFIVGLLALSIAVGALGAAAQAPRAAKDAAAGAQVIEWKDLVPPGWDPSDLVLRYRTEVARMKDDDPRAQQLAEDLRKAWETAPVVESLNDKIVKLSGFLVSLEADGKMISEFLLVPFFGACIHVPPPPSNQIVLVRTGRTPIKLGPLFQQVSVTGRLRTERARNDLASASYVIEATSVDSAGR